jgi:hypothetical protein
MDLEHFLKLILFDINDTCVNSPPRRDNGVAVSQSLIRYRILVCDCCDHSRGIPSSIHGPNVSRYLFVEKRFVDR